LAWTVSRNTLARNIPVVAAREQDEGASPRRGRLATFRGVTPPGDWPPSGIDPFLWQEDGAGAERIWTIRELRDGKELREEGQALHHCVATYENVCRRGEVSLWTMEFESQGKRQKVLTVEVRNRSCRIVQARGPCNAPATRQQREVLRRWALSAGLRLGG
jgi:hypothetical protein